MRRKKIKFIAPIGEVPSRDPELEKMLDALSDDASISDVFKVISEWEPNAVKRFRERERTKLSGRLHPVCSV